MIQTSWLFTLILLLWSTYGATEEEVQIYSYHLHPPFINAPQQGLSYDLVDFLNQKGAGQFHFTLHQLPRRRLNSVLEDWIDGSCSTKGEGCANLWMVPWVHPAWGFGAKPQDHFQWTELLADSSSIISRHDNPVDYQQSDSLVGLRFGGVGGHHYVGIDELVAQGKIHRIDGNHERDNLIKLLSGRIDATLLPTTTLNYYLQHDPLIHAQQAELYIAPQPHQQFMRYLMVPRQATDLAQFIAALELSVPSWQADLQPPGTTSTDTTP